MLKNKRNLVFITLGILLVGGLIVGFVIKNSNSSGDQIRGVNSVDYGPPSEQDMKETEEFKKRQQEQASTPDAQPKIVDGKKQVTPVISYAGQYDALFEASALIPTILEDGGICTLTLTNGQATVTKKSTAFRDAQTTQCTVFSFSSRELKPVGKWSAVVTYTSPTSQGTSNKVEVEVK